MNATLILTDGTSKEVSPKNSKDFSLEELQEFVGGYIEIVHLADGSLLVVNEEGKLQGLPYNEKATIILMKGVKSLTDFIVGNCLWCDSKFIK